MPILLIILIPLGALVIYAVVFDLSSAGTAASPGVTTSARRRGWLVRTRTPLAAVASAPAATPAGLAPSADAASRLSYRLLVSYRHLVGCRRSPGNLASCVTRSIGKCRMSLWSAVVVSIQAHGSGGGGFPMRLAAPTAGQSVFLISIHVKDFRWSGGQPVSARAVSR